MHRMALSQITWQDVQQLPDDGHRYEAIAGELHVTPAPTVRHQWISGELERSLYALVHDSAAGIVLHAPVGVEFPSTGEGVQPDHACLDGHRAAGLASSLRAEAERHGMTGGVLEPTAAQDHALVPCEVGAAASGRPRDRDCGADGRIRRAGTRARENGRQAAADRRVPGERKDSRACGGSS